MGSDKEEADSEKEEAGLVEEVTSLAVVGLGEEEKAWVEED